VTRRKKVLFVFSIVLVFFLGTFIGSTSTYSKNITAWFYPIQVNIDGTPIHFKSSPFIYNNYIYVPINDLTKHLNFQSQWDNKSKTLYLFSDESAYISVNALRNELDHKNLEISNLKFQISQLNTQLGIYKGDKNSSGSSNNNNKLRNLQDTLEERYERHRNNGRTLRFNNYRLYQLVDDTIRVQIRGDFRRSSNEWKNAKVSEFEDFMDDICREINKKFKEDIEIITYDDDNSKIAEYSYEQRKDKLKKEYFYSLSGGSGKDKGPDLDDLEEIFEEDYYSHLNNGRTLEFDKYELTKLSGDDIRVKMYGTFKRDDREWENLKKSEFESFIEDICEEINKEFEKDIEIIVYDRNNNRIAEYFYNYKRENLSQRYFYNR
jgi:hypothetical protein